ncbi:hypothetical protein DL93DRAFT_356864 [Clavulina sp. PMI_390]|nr:hypothetical protein DL93DRAFT_356864 [Clavulina sp. PMI_390]
MTSTTSSGPSSTANWFFDPLEMDNLSPPPTTASSSSAASSSSFHPHSLPLERAGSFGLGGSSVGVVDPFYTIGSSSHAGASALHPSSAFATDFEKTSADSPGGSAMFAHHFSY